MHYPVFEHYDTLSIAYLVCIILYIDGKQFRCSDFTFVQYILYYILFDDPWPRFFKPYWSIENFAARVFRLYISENFNKILIENL